MLLILSFVVEHLCLKHSGFGYFKQANLAGSRSWSSRIIFNSNEASVMFALAAKSAVLAWERQQGEFLWIPLAAFC